MENDSNLTRSPFTPLMKRHSAPTSENVPPQKLDLFRSEKEGYLSSPKRIGGRNSKEKTDSPLKKPNSFTTKLMKLEKPDSPLKCSPSTLADPSSLQSSTDHIYQSLDAAHQTIRQLERLLKEMLEEKVELEQKFAETMSLLTECRQALEEKEEEEILLQLQHERDEAMIQELQEALQETLIFCEQLEEQKKDVT